MNNDTLFFPVIDNGCKISATAWGFSLFGATINGALQGRKCCSAWFSCPYPQVAMCYATKLFLESPADRMVVIDTDIAFNALDLARLVSHDVDFVAGMYCKKKDDLEFVLSTLDGKNPFSDNAEEMEKTPLIELKYIARGFMNVHRRVFEKMENQVGDFTYDGIPLKKYWHGLDGMHSEDFDFCNRMRENGTKVLVDQRIRVMHWGMTQFPKLTK